MIQANELRIGNYVTTITASENEYTKVNGNDFWHYQNIDNPIHRVEWNSLKPIPLTEEWLLKLGLEPHYFVDNKLSGWHKNGVKYLFSDNQLVWFDMEIKSVHQLQNLYFALTGTELTLKP